MEKVNFRNAHYITLAKDFVYGPSSIDEGKMRFSWDTTNLADIHHDRWDKIKTEIQIELAASGSGAANRDFNSLKSISQSTSEDIWITRYNGMMWWGFLKKGKILEDKISKYRELEGSWHNTDISGKTLWIDIKGKDWFINGKAKDVAKTLKFSATRCNISAKQTLKKLINAELDSS